MNPTIRHTGIVVHDLSSCINFWKDVMGFTVVKEMIESGHHIDKMMNLKDVVVTTVKMTNDTNQLIELLYFSSHFNTPRWLGNTCSTGLTHIAFTVDEIDSILVRFRELGYNNKSTPQLSPDGSVKVIYAEGPEGLILELVEILNPKS